MTKIDEIMQQVTHTINAYWISNKYKNEASLLLKAKKDEADLRAMIEDALKPPSGWKLVPAYPDELSIQAGCLSQSDGACASYMEWVDTHSSGIIERIRHCVINDYMSMLSAAPKYEGKS